MKYLFLFILILSGGTFHAQLMTWNGYDIYDYLESATHPQGCNPDFILGLPDDSTWVNMIDNSVMVGFFSMNWTDQPGDDLLLETSYHSTNYNVRLLLTGGGFTATINVTQPSWIPIPNITWEHIFATCDIGSSFSARLVRPMDFASFGIGPGDVVTGIEITFLPTGGAPDLAGVYIIAPPCGFLSLGPDESLCEGQTLDLDATTPGATSYEWQDGTTGPFYTNAGIGDYWVEVTFDECTIVDTIHITEASIPLELGNDTIICEGETLLLNATTPGATYQWQNNTTQPTFTVTQPGNYSVEVTLDGCVFTDDIQVDYQMLPTVDLGNDTTLCDIATLLLDATLPGATYEWQDNSTNATFLVSDPGTYAVTVSINDCPAEDEIEVDYVFLDPDLGDDLQLCFGENIILNAFVAGATYEWQDNSGSSNYLVEESGIYSVTVTLDGCSAIDAVEVNYTPEIEIDLGNDTEICNGASLVLDAGTSGATYEWQDNSTLSTYIVEAPGLYAVTVTVGDCSANDEIEITFSDVIDLDLGNDIQICPGETVLLQADVPGATYEWQDNSSSSTYLVTTAGIYAVTVEFNDCIASDVVTVSYTDEINIDLGSDTTLCTGETIVLNANTSGASYSWQDNSSLSSYIVNQPGEYWVEVEVDGCISTDTIHIDYLMLSSFSLGNDTALCNGENLLLEVSQPGASFLWQDNSTASQFVVNQAGTYWVHASLANCTTSDTIEIQFHNVAPVALGNDTALCPGATLTLLANSPGAAFEWQDLSTNPSLLVTSPGLYWVSASIENCIMSDTIAITYVSVNSVDLGNDTTLCNGEELLLEVIQPGASFLWQNNSTGNQLLVDQAGSYWVQASLANCTASDTIEIQYHNVTPVNLGNDTALCPGATLTLLANSPGALYEWQDLSTSSSFLVTSPGVYWVSAYLDNCISSDTVVVTYVSLNSVDLGNDTTICDGQILVLNANIPGAAYLWNDNSTQAALSVGQQGIYWLEVSVDGCSATDTVEINVVVVDTVDLGNDTTLCSNENLLLNVTQAGASYEWQDNSTNPFFTVTQAGSYWVTVAIGACRQSDTLQVLYNFVTPIELGNDTTLCIGETLVLNAEIPGATFFWQDGSSQSMFTVSEAGVYNVIAQVNDCEVIDSIHVAYLEISSITLGSDTIMCAGETLTLTANAPGAEYEWSDNSTEQTLDVTQAGEYWVKVSLDACEAADTILVNFSEPLLVDLGADTLLCTGTTLLLNVEASGAAFLWQDNSTGPSFLVIQPGIFSVLVSRDNCSTVDSIQVDYSAPVLFDLGDDKAICEGESLLLDPLITEEVSYKWQDNSTSQTFTVLEEGLYWLEVQDECGTRSDSISITRAKCHCRVYVPNIFTPNGDQVNDFFAPQTDCDITFYQLTIFDRSGGLLYETNEWGKSWDGYVKSKEAQVGVYTYLLEYAFDGEEIIRQHGDLTIIR